MGRLSDEEILRQSRSAREATEAHPGPRVAAARYDPGQGTMIVNLDNGATFIVPAAFIEGLSSANDEERSHIMIPPLRDGVDWPTLDIQVDLEALMMGIFGSKKWMASLGRAGGATRTEAKARAARENGKKGGRPSKRRTG